MRIVFLGSGAFGIASLESLTMQHEVVLVVTQPDRPAGRGKVMTATPIALRAEELGVPVLKPEDVNEDSVRAQVRAVDADAWVVIAFGQKLSPELLEGVFAVNLHGSLLPQYRGAAPIQRAVMDGRASTGVSVIALAQRMDAGVVYAMRTRAIGATETSDDVHDELALLGPEVIQEVLFKHEAGTLEGVVQDEGLATRARKLSKAESSFDVALLTAHEARARINGLNSWPGFSAMLGELSVKILRVQEVSSEGTAAVGILGEDGRIRTSAGAIEVLSIQPLGSKPMTFAEFARGRRSCIGLPVLPLKQQ